MKYLIHLFVAVVLLASCRKNELPGDKDLGVHVTITDDISGTGVPQPFANMPVFITNVGDTTTYLYSARTDANGFVTFAGVAETGLYDIYSSDTRALLQFTGRRSSVLGAAEHATLELKPGYAVQNGVLITCTDTAAEGLVPGLRVHLYVNQELAMANDTLQSLVGLTTDTYGRVHRTDMATGTYYARIHSTDAQTDLTVEFHVPEHGIIRVPVAVITPAPTGVRLHCVDAQQAAIPQVSICAFHSQAQAEQGECPLAAFQGTAGLDGTFVHIGVAPGTYWLRMRNATFHVDTVVTCNVIAQQVTETTYTILPIPTGLRIHFTDMDGGGLPQLQVCGYASAAVAAVGDCGLSIFNGTTDTNGWITRTGIQAQLYYVRVMSVPLTLDTTLQYMVLPQQVQEFITALQP